MPLAQLKPASRKDVDKDEILLAHVGATSDVM